ncbi:helix-turn-helix domain-containing protein [Sulfurimonas aquatica]|uniref:Helix-turn-helix domain-containing protein n=1 Tax=Sulfurimonas aquatica TaxID=2672570 RepID=A0A975B1L6_9BACT|nr:AraC family transcriptional regulator [Sulfurimonas aquatica]QSZ42552.1 helix-turn-helix domain-containing protein [Sulfurimonas aquatica]
MKRETLNKKTKISNDILFYIYTNIEIDINMDELAQSFNISKFYMHKIFKEIFGRNIYESIKSIRLQKASTLLLTNKYSTITEIASSCGYSSQTSFIRVFKDRFLMTPTAWRKGGYKKYSKNIIEESPKAKASNASFENLEPTIVKMPEIEAYYLRHSGYNDQIKQTWQKIQTWSYGNNIKSYKHIALFHDNPTVTHLDECQYVACIQVDKDNISENERLPKFKISSGIYAKFDIHGTDGDFLRFMHWLYNEWLPHSEYETTTKPPYAIYKKNKYLSDDNNFDLSFYLSIKF